MLRLLKKLIAVAILVATVIASWKIYRASEDRPKLTSAQRDTQRTAQDDIAVALRVKELEDTNGAGRVRMNRETENAARMIYNTRHPSSHLPLLP